MTGFEEERMSFAGDEADLCNEYKSLSMKMRGSLTLLAQECIGVVEAKVYYGMKMSRGSIL